MKTHLRYLIVFVCCLLLSGCSAMFQGKIPLQQPGGSLNDLFKDHRVTVQLKAPSQIFAVKGASPAAISISWNPVAGASSYIIERAVVAVNENGVSQTPGEEKFERLQKVFDTTSYTDLIIGTEPTYKNSEYKNHYYYRVCAASDDDQGLYSPVDYGFLLGTTTSVTAEAGESTERIRVQWSRVPGASRYKIYRTVNSNGTGAEYLTGIGSTDVKYDNKMSSSEQGTEFYYYITAVSSSGVEGVKSPLAMGFSLMPGAPPAPKMKSVARGTSNDRIKITFEPASGAKNHIVFRNSSEDSTLIRLKELEGTVSEFTDEYTQANEQYFKPGVYYYYFVQATKLSEDGTNRLLKSPFSAAKDSAGTVVNEGFMLSPPTEINVFSVENGVRFEWKLAIGSGAEQSTYEYKLYHSDSREGPFGLAATLKPQPQNGWLIDISEKTKGYFRLATTYGSVESDQSIVVEPSPLAARVVAVTRESVLAGTQPNSNGVLPVKITWQQPETEAVSYHVLRSTSADGGFARITGTPVAGLEYVDSFTGAKPGVLYHYRVLSLNSLGQGALYSQTASGYGALTGEAFYREYVKSINSSHKKLTLMHKSNDMDKLGSESASGTRSGTLSYNAAVQGLGARITMNYNNYADLSSPDGSSYMVLNGNTNTTANMSANGTMDGTVQVAGMYNGSVGYNNIEIKGGNAGGGYYVVVSAGQGAKNVVWNIK